MSSAFRHLSGDLVTLLQCEGFGTVIGKEADGAWDLGSMPKVGVDISADLWQVFGYNGGAKFVLEEGPKLKQGKITLQMSQFTRLAMAMRYMAKDPSAVFTQVAILSGAAVEFTFGVVKLGNVYFLKKADGSPVKNVKIESLMWGTLEDGEPMVEGTHYKINRRKAAIQFLAIPEDGEGTAVNGAFSAGAITTENAGPSFGVMGGGGILLKLWLNGTGDQGQGTGELDVNRVRFVPGSEFGLVDTDEPGVVEVTGTMLPDESFDDEFQFGRWTGDNTAALT